MKAAKIFVICMLVISCKKLNNFDKTLIDSSRLTFWKELTGDSTGKFSDAHLRINFFENHEFEYYLAFNEFERGEPLVNIDGVYDMAWSFEEKTKTLKMGRLLSYKLIKYNSDTIVLRMLPTFNKVIFVRLPFKDGNQ
jgi:hypothetical protein